MLTVSDPACYEFNTDVHPHETEIWGITQIRSFAYRDPATEYGTSKVTA